MTGGYANDHAPSGDHPAALVWRGAPHDGTYARHTPIWIPDLRPGPTWDRRATVKARYDPTKLFHHNQNIPPAKGDPDDQNDPRAAA